MRLLILIALLLSLNMFGQRSFTVFSNSDEVEASYRWKRSRFFNKDSPLQLVLQIKNKTSEAIHVKFTLTFFWQSILNAESETVELCIKPRKTKKGAMAGLVFEPGEFTNEQLKSSDFTFDITDLVITKK
ncbi:MAG: hypothetical protein PHT69_06145 [Bacteroidales bacterium]|nr:hypothetical protein [Bacteroidales bacterium]